MTKNALSRGKGERILVLAPTGRDGSAACALLEQAGLSCRPCSRLDELQRELVCGAGAAVIAEEAFLGADAVPLFGWVSNQPPWSDFPFVILTTRRDDPRVRRYTLGLIDKLRNVTLQERPIQTVTVARRSGWERSGNQDKNPVSRHWHDRRGAIVAQAELRFWMWRRGDQALAVIVAWAGGRPRPRLRSSAARRR